MLWTPPVGAVLAGGVARSPDESKQRCRPFGSRCRQGAIAVNTLDAQRLVRALRASRTKTLTRTLSAPSSRTILPASCRSRGPHAEPGRSGPARARVDDGRRAALGGAVRAPGRAPQRTGLGAASGSRPAAIRLRLGEAPAAIPLSGSASPSGGTDESALAQRP